MHIAIHLGMYGIEISQLLSELVNVSMKWARFGIVHIVTDDNAHHEESFTARQKHKQYRLIYPNMCILLISLLKKKKKRGKCAYAKFTARRTIVFTTLNMSK